MDTADKKPRKVFLLRCVCRINARARFALCMFNMFVCTPYMKNFKLTYNYLYLNNSLYDNKVMLF